MAKFRKRPVVVEAVQFTEENINVMVPWLTSGCAWGIGRNEQDQMVLTINTLEGAMTANTGDYIIKGVKGEFYPCREDIFLATYEPA